MRTLEIVKKPSDKQIAEMCVIYGMTHKEYNDHLKEAYERESRLQFDTLGYETKLTEYGKQSRQTAWALVIYLSDRLSLGWYKDDE